LLLFLKHFILGIFFSSLYSVKLENEEKNILFCFFEQNRLKEKQLFIIWVSRKYQNPNERKKEEVKTSKKTKNKNDS
jgi:hypothetical protein